MLLLFFQQHKCKSKSHLKSINRNNNKKPMQIGRSRRGATLVVAVVGWDGMGWDAEIGDLYQKRMMSK